MESRLKLMHPSAGRRIKIFRIVLSLVVSFYGLQPFWSLKQQIERLMVQCIGYRITRKCCKLKSFFFHSVTTGVEFIRFLVFNKTLYQCVLILLYDKLHVYNAFEYRQ